MRRSVKWMSRSVGYFWNTVIAMMYRRCGNWSHCKSRLVLASIWLQCEWRDDLSRLFREAIPWWNPNCQTSFEANPWGLLRRSHWLKKSELWLLNDLLNTMIKQLKNHSQSKNQWNHSSDNLVVPFIHLFKIYLPFIHCIEPLVKPFIHYVHPHWCCFSGWIGLWGKTSPFF